MKSLDQQLGLYIHIPFCARLCHYCDFAKTANFSVQHVQEYFSVLEAQLRSWLQHLGPNTRFSSVFFGGGTPGLFAKEYDELFAVMASYLPKDVEVTIEANPHNVTNQALRDWRSLGINRISIGVQSFSDVGLKALTRDHSSSEALRAIANALSIMPHVNADLIYGWPGQTQTSWQDDLETLVQSGVQHASLYALTFEGQTPFARSVRRGALAEMDGDRQAEFYATAMRILGAADFEHEEISNWAKPGHSCRHNWLYWTGKRYVGVGAGAHGYVASDREIGLRYSYPGDLRKFLRDCVTDHHRGMQMESDRTVDDWLMEYVGCGLRCEEGIDLSMLEQRGFQWLPSPLINNALQTNALAINAKHLTLAREEWFRETAWSTEVLSCLQRL